MIRVLVVDDHAVVRQGLERLIGTWEGVAAVGEASTADQAVARYSALRPDIVLMDLGLGDGGDGVLATARIVAVDPGARIIALTSHPDRDHVERALEAGAIGYLLKYASADEVERGVRAAARGESPLDPKVAGLLIRRPEVGPAATLSPREREVLDLVGKGLSNKLIAHRLSITERTVKGHLTSIYRQIGVTDRLGAALVARGEQTKV